MPSVKERTKWARIPRHVGFIPDGNRRWADARGLPREAGYERGIAPGLRLLAFCRELGIEEASVYGFTRENVQRPAAQVERFRDACAQFGLRAAEAGAALRVIGDADSPVFPDALRPFAERRSAGDLRVNFLVNYGWQWDLHEGLRQARRKEKLPYASAPEMLASRDISRIDLVVRWGGRRRLSGFIPMQCAYADLYVIDTLWPDSQPGEFRDALAWYQDQETTLGG